MGQSEMVYGSCKNRPRAPAQIRRQGNVRRTADGAIIPVFPGNLQAKSAASKWKRRRFYAWEELQLSKVLNGTNHLAGVAVLVVIPGNHHDQAGAVVAFYRCIAVFASFSVTVCFLFCGEISQRLS